MKKTFTLKSIFAFALLTFCSGSLHSQTVQINSATYPGPAATSCTNTFIDVNVTVLCINTVYNGSSFNVSGNVIDINLDHSLGPICLGAIGMSVKNINLGMLPANTYTVNINGVLNNNGVSTLVSSLTVTSCCSASPAFSLDNSDTICAGDSISFNSLGSGLTSTKWYDNNVFASSTSTFGKRFNSPGAYQIKLVVADASCSDSLTKTIQVNAIPQANLGADTAICEDSDFSLWAGNNLDSVRWSDGSAADSLAINAAGTYSLTVHSGGCSSTDDIVISILQAPVIDIGSDTIICQGDSVLLDATVAGATYLWQDNSTSSTLVARSTGTYWVEVKGSNGCVTSTSMHLQIDTSCTISTNDLQSLNNFSLYPNPAKNRLFIQSDLPKTSVVNLKITDSQGRLILDQNKNHSSLQEQGLDLSKLPKGFYILQFSSGQFQSSQSFILE